MKLVCCVILVFLLSGCAPKQIYFLGDYSETLYGHEKDPSEETFLLHKQGLEHIITESETRALPIPPGICAELGYIYLKMNDSKRAIALFSREKQIFPESTVLMDRLIQKATAEEQPETSEEPPESAMNESGSVDMQQNPEQLPSLEQ